ncbi:MULTISPECIES: flagellar export chaperone FliS [Gracilibacillus]|uniref:Flagellar secretion chaperone FliS n=1 Tax=Gracilibacillus dipsosauri TaxID=178340 RepID=A0A317L0Y2_9BACI|nr:flagellar export chaperone FliS [Gracilibacillus dipsosauri]PWU69285.1 flagella export chaperone FliS [Gracilibacillus dipsosauri]
MAKQYQAYQNNSVTTATPGELTLMLYNGCLKFIKQARKAIEENNHQVRNEYIQKSQNIIRELMVTLNPEATISQEMLPLYDFAYQSLTQANVHNDLERLSEAEEIIRQFRDTWKEVIQTERRRQYGQGAKA